MPGQFRPRRPRIGGLQRVRLEAASGGIDVDSAPASVQPGKGSLLKNYLTGEAGRTRQRGGIEDTGLTYEISAGNKARIVGYLKGNDKLLVGFADHNSSSRIFEPWAAPRKRAAGSDLASGKAGDSTHGLRLIDFKANTCVDVQAPASTAYRSGIPWSKSTRLGRFAYGFAYDSDNDIVTPTGSFSIGQNDKSGYERLTRFLRWDTTDTQPPVLYFCGPYGCQDLKLYYNKFMALGGRQPETGGGFVESNVVWYTRDLSANHHNLGFSPLDDFLSDNASATNFWPAGVPEVGAVADCTQGATSPSQMWYKAGTHDVVNRLNLPGDENDYGVAMAYVGRNLAIFKRRSIIILQGFDDTNWQLRTAVSGVGCIDPRSIVEANEGVYFLSQQGYMFFDGIKLVDVSRGLHRTLVQAGLKYVGDPGIAGGFAVAARLDQDYILLTIGVAPFQTTDVNPTTDFCGIYHLPSNSWTTFDSLPLTTTGDGPLYAGRTENYQFIMDQSKVFAVPYLTTPDNQADESKRGKDGSSVIETKWHSRTEELASPFERAKIHRVIIDYNWIVDAGTAEQYTGPTVTLCDGAGVSLGTGASFTLPSGADAGNEVLRSRHVQDVYAECSEIMVKIEYTGTARALVQCDVQDVFLEYEITHERHTTS